jgi:2'-5' RNA ligase
VAGSAPTLRCFVAIDVSSEVRAAVTVAQARVRTQAPDADVRWTDREQIHLTLKFLGAVPEERVQAVSSSLEAVVADASPIDLAAAGLGAFPSLRRPRVLWAGVSAGIPELTALAAAVDGALAPLGFSPEPRAFSAHLTIGRVRSPRGARALAPALEGAGAAEFGSWTASELVLYESRLRPAGALYVPVSRHRLRGGPP